MTSAANGTYYDHTFKIRAGPADVPYITLFRGVDMDFGETVSDVKIASLVLDMQAINYVTGEWSAAGIEPTLVSDISAWSPAPDVSAPFVSCVGEVLLEGGETPLTLPVRAATLTVANAQQVDGNFVIGQYTPLDIDVISRVVTLTYVVQVTGSTLYGKLMYDPAGGTAWDPDVFNTAAIQHLTFKSAEDQAGMTLTPIPYELSLTAAEAHWFAEPVSMRGRGQHPGAGERHGRAAWLWRCHHPGAQEPDRSLRQLRNEGRPSAPHRGGNMLTIKPVSLKPMTRTIESHDVTVTVRRATLADEGQRYAMLFSDRETAMITDIAIVEAYLTLVECDIVTEDEEPLLQAGMGYEEFVAGMTAVWQYSADLFWKMHEVVREANPHWNPAEGNEPSA